MTPAHWPVVVLPQIVDASVYAIRLFKLADPALGLQQCAGSQADVAAALAAQGMVGRKRS
ncbi:hypothetical protein [Paludibacterium denitrificans]|uniref:Uncharacterized protein n=1 Tax=Paludibacterium denitrificans TaxID=2675226 RepID=A0A844GCK3_9NEIS|nr:hypothetical protein [Paludibacterium denitrificans]MTD33021.1 hypothetical protein [Paludibacterium denitrificans]